MLPEKMQEAYAFIKDYESLLKELQTVLCAVRHVEAVCKNEGFSVMTSRKCKQYIIRYHRIYFWYLQEQEVTEQTIRCNVFCPDDTVVLKSRKRIRYKNN